jgi:alpha-glucosidase
MWTGDNVSNQHHMKGAIALSLNLSVSGMPFNGPDVPGFAGDASDELMRAWYKLGFLFPFLRNHNVHDAADQEPWSRGGATTRVVTEYIRLRYKLLPYLYQAFQAQAQAGDPVLRPLWYHDPSPDHENTDDAFFVGEALLQAPFTTLDQRRRTVRLPRHAQGTGWYDVDHRRWVDAGTVTQHRRNQATTPVFLASPSALGLQQGVRTTAGNRLDRLDVLLVLREGETVVWKYRLDDGLTEAWREGAFSDFALGATLTGGSLAVTVENPARGGGGLSVRLLVLSPQRPRSVVLGPKTLGLHREGLRFAGRNLTVTATEEVAL